MTTGISALRRRVLEDDRALADALRARGPHVVLLEHLEQRRPHEAGDHRHAADRDGERGQHEVQRAVVAGDRQQVGLEADVDHQHQPHPERRRRHAGQRADQDDGVGGSPAMERGPHADQRAHEHRGQHAGHRELERGDEAREHLGGRPAPGCGSSGRDPRRHVAHVERELHGHRPLEPQALADGRRPSRGVASVPAITMAGSPGISRSIANTSTVIDEQGDDELDQARGDVAGHGRPSAQRSAPCAARRRPWPSGSHTTPPATTAARLQVTAEHEQVRVDARRQRPRRRSKPSTSATFAVNIAAARRHPEPPARHRPEVPQQPGRQALAVLDRAGRPRRGSAVMPPPSLLIVMRDGGTSAAEQRLDRIHDAERVGESLLRRDGRGQVDVAAQLRAARSASSQSRLLRCMCVGRKRTAGRPDSADHRASIGSARRHVAHVQVDVAALADDAAAADRLRAQARRLSRATETSRGDRRSRSRRRRSRARRGTGPAAPRRSASAVERRTSR